MFVLHLITLHIGHKKHQASLHIYEEDAHKIWEHVFISKCAVGTTTGHHGKKGGGEVGACRNHVGISTIIFRGPPIPLLFILHIILSNCAMISFFRHHYLLLVLLLLLLTCPFPIKWLVVVSSVVTTCHPVCGPPPYNYFF